MDFPLPLERVYRFDQFKFYSRSGLLEHAGLRVRLNFQANRLLGYLLANRDRVITRDELRHLLWPDTVNPEYENGISRTVSLLRQSLRDSSRKQPYIQTFPKVGYRFYGEVHEEATQATVPTKSVESRLISTSRLVAADYISSAEIVLQPVEPLRQFQPLSVRILSQQTNRLYASIACAVLLISGLTFLMHTLRRDASGENSLNVAFAITAQDKASRAMATRLQSEVVHDFAAVPGLMLDTPEHVAQKPLLSLAGSMKQAPGGYFVTIPVQSEQRAEVKTYSYTVATDAFPFLHRKIEQDLYRENFRPLLLAQSRHETLARANDSTAFDLYLRAEPLIAKRRSTELEQAKQLLEEALRRDPGFALAQARLALATMLAAVYGTSEAADYERSQTLALEALKKFPELAEAKAVLGFLHFHYIWNFALAETELKDAVRLEPENVQFRVWLALLLSYEGDSAAASEELQEANTLDPGSSCVHHNEILLLGNARRYREMGVAARKNLQENGESAFGLSQLAWALWYQQEYAEAVELWKRSAELAGLTESGAFETQGLHVLKKSGTAAYARLKAEAIRSGRLHNSEPGNRNLAEWYSYAGNKDAALHVLEQQYNTHDQAFITARVNPAFANLHEDPRFASLIWKVWSKQELSFSSQ